MNILIAALHPPNGSQTIGGVQSWSTTVGDELESRGHSVIYWGPEFPLPKVQFDAGIFANIVHTRTAERLCKKVLRVSHGIITEEAGGDAFTSEEVRAKWKGSGPIIRQPINLSFWKPQESTRRYLTRFSYRGGLGYLPEIAKALGLEYKHLKSCNPETCRDVINQSAVVIATGRAACESMACDVPVVIADEREYQGPLLDNDTEGAVLRNYSGRGGIVPDNVRLKLAIEWAMARGGMRYHAETYHDHKKITDQIMGIL